MGQAVGNPGAWPMGNANQGRNRLGGGGNKAHTQVFRPAVKYNGAQGEYQATFWRLIYSDQVHSATAAPADTGILCLFYLGFKCITWRL